jgi:hypothetical protein
MTLDKFVSSSAAAIVAAGAMFASVAPTQAFMFPTVRDAAPNIQLVDCAAGFRLGPIGTCILGTDEPRHDGDHRDGDASGGCDTKSMTKTDAAGNSETKTRTNC